MGRRRRGKSRLPQSPVTTSIEGFSHDGAGIARIDGKATFIQGALPGETVTFQYTEQKSQYDKGQCLEVITPSPLRANPKCQHYAICGGCSLQHLLPEAQVQLKEKELANHLEHIGKTILSEKLPSLEAKKWGYRHKARLSVRYVEKKEKVLVGFRERLSGRFIADINRCVVLHPVIGELIEPLKAMILDLSNFKDIAQLEVAIGDKQNALIIRHLTLFTEADIEILQRFAKSYDITWYLQPGGPDSVHALNDTPMLSYQLPEWDIRLDYKPTDFTQINPSINNKMVSQALKLLDPTSTDTVLDLFCGLGNFSLPLASQVKKVIGVEGSLEMVERATMNAKKNGLTNTQFFEADLFKPIEGFDWASITYDKILLDPPRAGALSICQNIERFNARRIVYVSCSPQTLARDTGVLVHEKGYRLLKAGVMDMFPHTAHVESIALFEKED